MKIRYSTNILLKNLAFFLISLSLFTELVSAESSIHLRGVISYNVNIDPVKLTQDESLVYTLYISNQESSASILMVKIVLKNVVPDSIKISEGNASIVNIRTYGNLTIVDLMVSAPSGDSTIEIKAKPTVPPIGVNCALLVNSRIPKLSYFKNYEFLSLNVNDSIGWNITITNNEASNSYLSNLKIPVLFSAELNSQFLEVKDITPQPNSSTSEGTYSWTLIVSNTTTISINARVKNFSDWGTISLSPYTLSYSSYQLDKAKDALLNANKSLSDYLNFLNSSYYSVNSSLSIFTEFKNKLDFLANSLSLEGETLQLIGKNLTSAAKNLDNTILDLDVVISSVSTAASFLSTPQVGYFISDLPELLQEARNSLQSISSSQASDILQLLELNQTLSYVYYYTTNSSLKQSVLNSINIVNGLIRNARQRQSILNNTLNFLSQVNAEDLKNTLSTVRNQVLKLSSSLSSMKNNILSFKSSLVTLGNSLVKAGEMNIEQSNIIKNATRNLEAQINTTQSQLNELMNKINDVEKNLENVRNEIKSLDNKQKELIYISPEILDENYIATINGGGKIFQENITSAFKKDSIFIQYLILYNNSDKPIVIPIFNFAKETKESLFDLNGVPLNITLGSSSSYVTVIARVGEVNDLEENYFANIVQYNIANVNISKNQFNFNPSKKQESFTNYQYLLVPICIVAGFVVVAMYSKSLIQKSKRRKKLNKILSRIKLP
ncbi:MAG: hypothetical protein QW768_00570 [Thermoproteota archaeon]|nr:hypothetical protein [Candidatus Brockarchaeota archaeon]